MIKKSFKTLFCLIATFLILIQPSYALNLVELSPGYYPNSSRGRALASADIYVGKPDLDPEIVANQKTLSVQQEDGTIIAVTQPISTGAGGVPQYAGSPVTLLVEGDYSLKVLDSSGVQIYYVPSTAYEQYLIAGNYYYPDYSEADQGVVGGGETVTDILAEVGIVTNATMYFSHNSGAATTTYTFTTNTTITDNFNIIIEEGVILDGAGTLTVNSIEAKSSQIFGSSITVLGLKFVNAAWFAIADDATDNAAALTNAAGAMVDNSTFWVPPGLNGATYYFSSGFEITTDDSKFICDGILTYTGTAGVAISLGSATETAYNLLAHIRLTKNTQNWTQTCTGVRYAGVQRSEIHLHEVSYFTTGIELVPQLGGPYIYFNNTFLSEIANNKRALYFDNSNQTGGMNANNWYGGSFKDSGTGLANGGSYVGSYFIYIPVAGGGSAENGNQFFGQSFDLVGGSYTINNFIYCGGDRNNFYGLRTDGRASDIEYRCPLTASNNTFHSSTGGLFYLMDVPNTNNMYSQYVVRLGGQSLIMGRTFDADYISYAPGDRIFNNAYDEQADSPSKIVITAGSYWPNDPGADAACTATTTALDATVTLSANPEEVVVGTYIDIVGVGNCPLHVLSRDYAGSTIEVSPAPDSSVAGSAISYSTPTFADETPASLRGYKTWDPANILAAASLTTTTTVTGAEVGDMVWVGAGVTTQGMTPFGYVNAADTVTFGLLNGTAGAIDLANSTWYVRVVKY